MILMKRNDVDLKNLSSKRCVNIGDGQHRIIDIEAKDEKDAVKNGRRLVILEKIIT